MLMEHRLGARVLVDMAAIAERAGVTRGTVRTWRYRYPDFPKPLVRLRIGPIWYWWEVEWWLKERGRMPRG